MNLLQTKLRIPPVRPERVPRPHLHALLHAGLDRRLTLVSAPAGFGKTTLLCDWLAELGFPVAWLTLDDQDNAWPRFLAYLLTSLQGIEPRVGAGLLGALESPQRPSMDSFLEALPAELETLQRPFVLVLDDFHVILDSQVHELINYVIDNQPPGMHIVVSGRADPPWPVGRLRATGALMELRAGDLRFTLEEAGSLLNHILHLDLTDHDLSALEERTEGWVTGLHLAALSLQHSADRHRSILAFADSDRFVLDYLMEEVLAQQPPDVCAFLLQTSLLDRFSASLSDHITGRDDSLAMLRRLEAANLFVVPLDSERLWFTYHALMRSFLRSVQLQQDVNGATETYRRASQWYAANGDIIDAILYALQARDHERVGQLIRTNGLALVFQGELETVLGWLHAYSETWLRAGPWLRIAQLWAHSFSGEASTMAEELTESRELVQEGLRALEDDPDSSKTVELRHALAHLTAIEANLAVMDGRHEEAARVARQALAGLPLSDLTTRRYAFVILGMALRHQGQLPAAADALAQADVPGRDLDQAPAPARGLATLAGIQLWMGQLDEAEATCRRILALHDEHVRRCGRRLPIAAFGYARLSEVLRQRNRLDEALRAAQESRALAEQWQQTDALYEGYTHLARALHARGDPGSALALLHRLERVVRERSPWLHAMTRAEQARVCIRSAQDATCLERARAWAQEYPLPRDGQLVFRDHPLYLAHALLLLHDARADRSRAQAGLHLARQIQRLLDPTGALGLQLEASLVRTLFEATLGHQDEALAHLLDCLRRAEPRGYVRLFLDFGPPLSALLSRVPTSDEACAYAQSLRSSLEPVPVAGPVVPLAGAPRQPSLEEPLSQRELEVLRLLGTALSSSEIADELCVATSTVRSHTKAVYGKLGVHTRLEALDIARELGLI